MSVPGIDFDCEYSGGYVPPLSCWSCPFLGRYADRFHFVIGTH